MDAHTDPDRVAPAAPAPRRWLLPWLAPPLLTALALAELVREGAAATPRVLLVQLVLAAPPATAGGVLLAVAE